MSKFLAPIHTWLFNKIKLYENLEANLVKAYQDKYGDEVTNLYNKIAEKYGYPLPNKPLEELIDVSNIHGWLQNKISIAETRHAAFITEMSNKYNSDDILDIALTSYSEQGAECGEFEKENSSFSSAEEFYNTINNYIIEGMPCDRVNSITLSTENKVQWETERCLHKSHWEEVGGNINIFYKLREVWIRSFIESINSNFTYNVTYNNGATPILIHEIIKR
ncbi:hypothetical protein [Clostridium thailandense]|uniref:hypothetical protein n=1 Tax=Clostridium thailandense TaxID=2794346 RepID=UPI00398A1EEA